MFSKIISNAVRENVLEVLVKQRETELSVGKDDGDHDGDEMEDELHHSLKVWLSLGQIKKYVVLVTLAKQVGKLGRFKCLVFEKIVIVIYATVNFKKSMT